MELAPSLWIRFRDYGAGSEAMEPIEPMEPLVLDESLNHKIKSLD
jgi:hypothetical protein